MPRKKRKYYPTTNVILTHVNSDVGLVATVKVLRQLMVQNGVDAGLKEGVDMFYAVRDRGKEQNLLPGVTMHHARKAREALDSVSAMCRFSQQLVPLE